MRLGADMYGEAERDKRAREELGMKKEKHGIEMEEGRLRVDASRRTAQREQAVDDEIAGLRSFVRGGFQPGDNGPMDESAAGYGVPSGSSVAPPADLGSPAGEAGLNTRMMGLAATKGDLATLQTLQTHQKALRINHLMGQGVQEYFANPQAAGTGFMQFVNTRHPLITIEPPQPGKDGRRGYPVVTINPATGMATRDFLPEDQAAMVFAAATKLMPVDPMAAMEVIGKVNQNIAASIQAANQQRMEATKTNSQNTHYANTDETNAENAKSNRITANAHMVSANAAASRASRENQSAGDKMDEQVNALMKQYMKANPQMSEQEARQRALDAVTKDPNRREDPDVGLPEAGIFKKGGKYFKLGKNGKPEEVQFPGESALDKALQNYLANGGKAPAKPGAGATSNQGFPAFPQMTAPAGVQPYTGNAGLIRDAERKQNR